MLVLLDHFDGLPIISMQTGTQIGFLDEPIVEPRNLEIVAFYVAPAVGNADYVLHASDVREINRLGVIVDHEEAVMELDESLVRLSRLVELDFDLRGMLVTTEEGNKLGKVTNYVIDTTSFDIVKLHTKQSFVKNFGVANLIIHRRQIVKVTKSKIIVQSTAHKKPIKKLLSFENIRLKLKERQLEPGSMNNQASQNND